MSEPTRPASQMPRAFILALPALIASALMALLPGCSLVPAYSRPDTPLAASFDGATDAKDAKDTKPATLADTIAVRSGWWRSFNDPSLNALVDQSLRGNYSLASAVASVEVARGNAEKAGAPQYPSLSVGGTFDRSHKGASGNTRGSTAKSQSLFGEASYEADFWGFNAANARSAAMLANASAFDRDTVALTLTASVANTYFQAQSLRERLDLARTIAADAERILNLLLAQQAAGVATELQVQQQRNALATFQSDIPTLQLQLDQGMHALAVLTGRAPEQFSVANAPLQSIAIPRPRPNLPSSLLETRPDIRSKEAALQAANYSVGAARAAFFPNIVLTADAGLSSGSLSHFLSSPFASLASSLAAPIFDGGALEGQLHANRAAFTRSEADYRQTVVTALQDVEDSLSAQRQQQLAEAKISTAADAARQAATLAEAQYKFGTVDFLTVLDAQRTLYQAQDTLLQARLLRLQAAVGLFRAFGGGFGITDASPAPSSLPAASNDSFSPDPS